MCFCLFFCLLPFCLFRRIPASLVPGNPNQNTSRIQTTESKNPRAMYDLFFRPFLTATVFLPLLPSPLMRTAEMAQLASTTNEDGGDDAAS